jgi:hypothetical protein
MGLGNSSDKRLDRAFSDASKSSLGRRCFDAAAGRARWRSGARRPAESMASGGELGDEVLRGGRAPPPNRARRSSSRARRRVHGEQGEVRAALALVNTNKC